MIAGELVARQLEWQLKVASAPFTIVSFSSVDLLGASVTLLTSDLLSEETEPAPGGATGRAEPLATGGGGVVAALAMVSEAARAVTRAVLRELDLHLAHLREPENAPDAGGIDPVLGT